MPVPRFAVSGDTVYCREGYRDAATVLLHSADVQADVYILDIYDLSINSLTAQEAMGAALGVVGGAGVELHLVGPCRQLEGLRAGLGRAGAELRELDTRAAWQ